jgi:hypothetical protein
MPFDELFVQIFGGAVFFDAMIFFDDNQKRRTHQLVALSRARAAYISLPLITEL